MHALVIDDSRAMRIILGSILRDLGFEVAEAAHGKEALQRLRENERTDVALVDWNMPEMNGFEFVRSVRAQPKYDALRLMMVTTETDLGRVADALEAGANEYVFKPFTKDALIQKLTLLGIDPPEDA